MTVTLSLGPNDDLEITLPSGSRRYVPVGPHSTQLLWQILWNATTERTQPVTRFPTQAVINQWAEETMPQRRAEERADAAAERLAKASEKLGIDLTDFQL